MSDQGCFHRTQNFTQISNTIIYDKRLSLKAKMILVLAASKPPNWNFYKSEMISNSTDSTTSFESGIKELETFGYLYKVKKKKENGQYSGLEWNFFEEPISLEEFNEKYLNSKNVSETRVSRVPEKPEVGKRDTNNTNSSNTNINNTKKTIPLGIVKESSPKGSHSQSKDCSNTPPKIKSKKRSPSLTEEEKDKLINKYGLEDTNLAIKELKDWKETQVDLGGTKITDYGRITRWVMKRVIENKIEQQKPKYEKTTSSTLRPPKAEDHIFTPTTEEDFELDRRALKQYGVTYTEMLNNQDKYKEIYYEFNKILIKEFDFNSFLD